MDIFCLTEELIEMLLQMPKQLITRRHRSVHKARHAERNLDVISQDGKQAFLLIERQSLLDADNFSCGLQWMPSKGVLITLTRYNGSSHSHSNPLEREGFEYRCHIHRATERYIQANRKIEHFALPTDRYRTLEGAKACLMLDCHIAPHETLSGKKILTLTFRKNYSNDGS